MSHTKGPWHACQNGTCKCKMVLSADDHLATVVSGKWGDKHNGKLIEYGEVPEKQAIANARLIAAAPELLEACESARSFVENVMATPYAIASPMAAMAIGHAKKRLRAAIAKAKEGEPK